MIVKGRRWTGVWQWVGQWEGSGGGMVRVYIMEGEEEKGWSNRVLL
jgi:hypothetical protein